MADPNKKKPSSTAPKQRLPSAAPEESSIIVLQNTPRPSRESLRLDVASPEPNMLTLSSCRQQLRQSRSQNFLEELLEMQKIDPEEEHFQIDLSDCVITYATGRRMRIDIEIFGIRNRGQSSGYHTGQGLSLENLRIQDGCAGGVWFSHQPGGSIHCLIRGSSLDRSLSVSDFGFGGRVQRHPYVDVLVDWENHLRMNNTHDYNIQGSNTMKFRMFLDDTLCYCMYKRYCLEKIILYIQRNATFGEIVENLVNLRNQFSLGEKPPYSDAFQCSPGETVSRVIWTSESLPDMVPQSSHRVQLNRGMRAYIKVIEKAQLYINALGRKTQKLIHCWNNPPRAISPDEDEDAVQFKIFRSCYPGLYLITTSDLFRVSLLEFLELVNASRQSVLDIENVFLCPGAPGMHELPPRKSKGMPDLILRTEPTVQGITVRLRNWLGMHTHCRFFLPFFFQHINMEDYGAVQDSYNITMDKMLDDQRSQERLQLQLAREDYHVDDSVENMFRYLIKRLEGTLPSGDTPGPSGATPGPSGDTPGPSGDTPGPSGATPGPSGATPGPSGATPGPSGDRPNSLFFRFITSE